MINAQISAGNNSMMNNYREQGVERDIVQQNAMSENISNAADKYTMIGNEKAKRQLDLQKAAWIKEIYRNSGVLDRADPRVKKALEDIGSTAGSYQNGGQLPTTPKRPTFKENPIPKGSLTKDELNYLGHKWRGNYSAEHLPAGGMYFNDKMQMQKLAPNQETQVKNYMKSTGVLTDIWQGLPNVVSDHRGKKNRLLGNGGRIASMKKI